MSTKMLPELNERLESIRKSLPDKISIASVFNINEVAGKWQAPYRSMIIREVTSYRAYDLLHTSIIPEISSIARKLVIRASLETIAMLSYLNIITEKVLSKTLDYFEFEETTIRLTLGIKIIENIHVDDAHSREPAPIPINVNNIVVKMSEKVPWISKIYDGLCEFAHPNSLGLIGSYSRINGETYETSFGFFNSDEDTNKDYCLISDCIELLRYEYSEIWVDKFDKLLQWIEQKDKQLIKQRERIKRKKESGSPPD
jgi:hypothetical protein